MAAPAPLRVLVSTARDEADWSEALRACLPEAQVYTGATAPACDYAVLWKPSPALFARQPRLKAMFSLGAGVNGLLAVPSLPAGVPLVRMEDAGMAEQMVEYALYVALREFRSMRDYARAQSAASWAPCPVQSRCAFRIGVLGLGVLGGAAARALADFGFDVTGWSRGPKVIDGVRCVHGEQGLDTVLGSSRLLLVFLPVTRETGNLLDAGLFARLPRGAAVANLARGELVDERALLDVLDSGHLSVAYLDVFRDEPLPRDHPFWRHPSVEITPHIAAVTDIAAACAQVADKIRRLEAGGSITGIVDRGREY